MENPMKRFLKNTHLTTRFAESGSAKYHGRYLAPEWENEVTERYIYAKQNWRIGNKMGEWHL